MALVLPPLAHAVSTLPGLGNGGDGFLAGIMSPQLSVILLQGALAVALFVRSRSLLLLEGVPVSESRLEDGQASRQKKGWKGRLTGGWGRIAATLVVMVLLLASSILWNWLSQFGDSPNPTFGENDRLAVQKLPLLLAYTAVAAFYEEMVYRWYGPALLRQLLGRTRFPFLWMELVLVIVFALSHSYGGWPAVGNALVGGTVLRICTLLTRTPFSGFSAHLIYNLIQLFLLLK